jgi:hypothetical protein
MSTGNEKRSDRRQLSAISRLATTLKIQKHNCEKKETNLAEPIGCHTLANAENVVECLGNRQHFVVATPLDTITLLSLKLTIANQRMTVVDQRRRRRRNGLPGLRRRRRRRSDQRIEIVDHFFRVHSVTFNNQSKNDQKYQYQIRVVEQKQSNTNNVCFEKFLLGLRLARAETPAFIVNRAQAMQKKQENIFNFVQ